MPHDDPTTNALDPHLLEQLPTLPGTAAEFLRLCEDPTVGVRDVADVARRDPALLARILQMANSPFYAPREPVTEVSRAAAILGLRSLKMIGVGFAILGDLWSSTTKSDQLAGIIGASAIAGSGAQTFSVRMGTGRDEEALTGGLLSFVGELALLRCYPEQFAQLWEDDGHLPSADRQREVLGADGVQVGALLMARWNMPGGLREGIETRARSIEERLSRSPNVYDAALGFGTAIAELLTGGEPALKRVRASARAWGLADDDLMGFWADFRTASRRTTQQLGLDVGAQLDAIIVDAKDEYMASSVHMASELDAARRQIEELQAENNRLEGLSMQDPLTGVPNRPCVTAHPRASLASMSRFAEMNVGVAMFDLDHFKGVNDSLGHLVGDELLTAIAAAGHRAARTNELFARLGGDEFAMVLQPQSLDELEVATTRVRQAMVEAADAFGLAVQTTVSVGAALLERLEVSVDGAEAALVQAADDALLYAAKRQGRNRVFVTSTMSTGLAAGSLDS